MSQIENSLTENILKDVEAVNKIPIIPQLLDVICGSTKMGFAAIARVTDSKWITCTSKDKIQFGLKKGDELEIETTMCREVKQTNKPIFIDNAEDDETYCNHPIPKMYGITSYVSFPIFRKNGEFFGTLCAIDTKPAKVKRPEIIGMFKLFAELISFHLQAIEDVTSLTSKLEKEELNASTREQFIAVLGHDLRNPLATTKLSADIIQNFSKEKIALKQAKLIKSTVQRMEGMINNILDFALGRFGPGIILNTKSNNSLLKKSLQQVIKEMRVISPETKFLINICLETDVNCDAERIAQLFSNLLTNAITHGAPEKPVSIEIISDSKEFRLSVSNSGEKISNEALDHLFQPFYRNKVEPGRKGLGLGLFISSEIARAHGGEMKVDSNEEITCFTLKIPFSKKN